MGYLAKASAASATIEPQFLLGRNEQSRRTLLNKAVEYTRAIAKFLPRSSETFEHCEPKVV